MSVPSPRVAAVCALVTALVLSATSAFAQSENVTLLKNLDTYSGYNDIWGWDGAGVELVLLGTTTGTSIVDATDPVNAFEVDFIPGTGSIWRDIKTFGNHAYIVNEDGGGLQVVDLSTPAFPTLVNASTDQFFTAHNVWVDTQAGLLYVVGAGNTTFIYDLNVDPVDPPLLTTFTNFYIHDMYTQDGIGYLAAIYEGYLATVDLSNPAGGIPVLDTQTSDDAFTHNVWTTTDGNYALTTDEVGGGHITVMDVSNPSDIQVVGSYTHPDAPAAIIHNVAIRDDYAYVSWYVNGLEIIDVSNPLSPQRVGYYDTHPSSGSGSSGAWGVYPYTPSGTIYLSDMNTGLYLLEFDNTFGTLSGNITDANSTLALEGVTISVPAASKTTSTDVNGDYTVILDPATYQVDYSLFGYAPQSINVNIFTATTTVQDVALAPLPTGGLSGTVTASGALAGGGAPLANALVRVQNTPLSTQTNGAGQYDFATVPEGGYTVEVILPGFASEQAPVSIVSPGTTTQNFALDTGDFADNFENDFEWIVGAVDDDATTGIWTRVDPIGTQGGTIQPENDHTVVGTLCFVTGQGSPGGSIGEADVDAGKTTLLTPVCNLSGFTNPTVLYWWWYVNDGNGTVDDTFRVDASEDGVTWVNLNTISTSSPAWSPASHGLAGLFSDYSTVQVRFVAEDSGGGSIVEAAIDDIVISDDVVVDVNEVTDVFATRLLPASPNPFRTDASIRFELAEAGRASLDVFDVQGRLVRRLVNDALTAGSHTIAWDGLSGVGATTPPGVYMLRLTTPDASRTSKIVRSR